MLLCSLYHSAVKGGTLQCAVFRQNSREGLTLQVQGGASGLGLEPGRIYSFSFAVGPTYALPLCDILHIHAQTLTHN